MQDLNCHVHGFYEKQVGTIPTVGKVSNMSWPRTPILASVCHVVVTVEDHVMWIRSACGVQYVEPKQNPAIIDPDTLACRCLT